MKPAAISHIKEEPFTLNSSDTGIIPAANRADGTASKWSDIWKYQVPVGQAHILRPGHRYANYLEDASAQVGNGTCRIRIVIRDQSEQEETTVLTPTLYVSTKEFQQDDKMARLDAKEEKVVEEQQFIVIQVYDDGAIDESDSYFILETIRVRKGI